MPLTSTPLRYPGGKSRLAPFFSLLLKENKVSDCVYVEPFAGGAGAAINLLRHEYVRLIYLNDIDPRIYAFWHSVLYYTDDLCKLVAQTPLTIEEWHRQRSVVRNYEEASIVELGFAVLFMNRTNRSGIITGGVIGGQRQAGNWKMDARFNRDSLIQKIRRLATYRQRVRLFSMDARAFMEEVVSQLKGPTFVYLDPPYYRKGQALYENHYKHEDHVALKETLESLNGLHWTVSYDNVPEIHQIYSGHRYLTYVLNYSAAQRYAGEEVMFFSPNTSPPSLGPLEVRHYA